MKNYIATVKIKGLFNNKKGEGQKDHIIKTVIPDTYRGTYTNNDGTAGKQYADDAIDLLNNQNITIQNTTGNVSKNKNFLWL